LIGTSSLLASNTLANYRSQAEKHIRPLIGSVKVGHLTAICSTRSTPRSGAAGTTAVDGHASTTEPARPAPVR
jgi:hypothetical protein